MQIYGNKPKKKENPQESFPITMVPMKCMELQYIIKKKNQEIVIFPHVHFDRLKSGEPMIKILDSPQALIQECEKMKISEDCLVKEHAIKHLRLAITSYEENKEWIRNIPYKKLEDLAVYVQWWINEKVCIDVTYEMLDQLKMSQYEIFDVTKKSMEDSICLYDMDDIINQHLLRPLDKVCQDMYVLTTEHLKNGAASIASHAILESIYQRLGTSYYILPSSVHEVILVTRQGINEEMLKEMVESINMEYLLPWDKLSDHVYKFDGQFHMVI